MRSDNPPSRVDAAILIASERFPHWEPSPTMLGFARAVGKVLLGDQTGDAVGLTISFPGGVTISSGDDPPFAADPSYLSLGSPEIPGGDREVEI